MVDRTTRFLLAVIAFALVGLLLRPLVTSVAALAAPAQPVSSLPQIAVDSRPNSNGFVYVLQDGRLYMFDTSYNGHQYGLRLLSSIKVSPKP